MTKTMPHADHATAYWPYSVVLQFIGRCNIKSALQFILQTMRFEEALQRQRKGRIFKICLYFCFCMSQMLYADLFPSAVVTAKPPLFQSIPILLQAESRVKQIAVPIMYMHDKISQGLPRLILSWTWLTQVQSQIHLSDPLSTLWSSYWYLLLSSNI